MIGNRLSGFCVVLVAIYSFAVAVPSGHADTIKIVAIGASNTAGKGVGAGVAWPAQLKNMLQAKGHKAQVINRGVNGNTTSQMRARLARSVPAGTQIVIFSIPLTNDRRRKVNTKANTAAMTQAMNGRGIKTIVISRPHVWGEHQMQSDRIHFTVAGHKTIAGKLVPMVLRLVGAK